MDRTSAKMLNGTLPAGFMMFANERDTFSARSLHGPGLYITCAIVAGPEK